MSGELHVVAIFHPAPGKEERLKETLIDIANKVYENEHGVLKYQIFEQVDSQTGTNVILFQETYADKAAVDHHLSTPYFGAMTELLTKDSLVTKPFEVLVINPIGGFASRG
ncbi:acid phosphatase protein [Rutstroemia sp. NJR-2017a BVV2]|nr:acid phosphatase protein [Rutstroemia sp. NJR-2017a BVV2]